VPDPLGSPARLRLWWARRRLRIGRYWQRRGDLDEAARHAYRALRLLRGSPVRLTGEVTLAVAEIERDRDQYGSSRTRLARLVDDLDRQPVVSPADRSLLARALIGLGDAYRRSGRYRPAVDTLGRACHLLDDGQPDLLAAALTTLAITHKEVGEFGQAQTLYTRVQRIQQETGAGAGQLADLHHNLAGLAYARRRYQQAEMHARQAVSLRRAARGNATGVAADTAVLAAILTARHRHDEARRHLDSAIAVCRAARPPRRYEIAVQLHNLAAVEQASGLPHRAESLYRQALAIKEELLGADHPEVALIANNLGTLLHGQQRTAEAAQQFSRALTIARNSYPSGHPATLDILHNLQATV
jgi:tetratricopeptide (TPR) repeat protein